MSLPLLLRVPLELLRAIVEQLDIRDQARLAMANRYLRSVIEPPSHEDFIQAETSEWASSKQLYTCKSCVSFRGYDEFADAMRKGRWRRHGPQANLRLCIQCGFNSNLYREGEIIVHLGRHARLGRPCSGLTDYGGRRTPCGSIVPAPISVYKMEAPSCWNRHHSANGYEWTQRQGVFFDINTEFITEQIDVHLLDL